MCDKDKNYIIDYTSIIIDNYRYNINNFEELQYISNELKSNKKFILEAIKINCIIFIYATSYELKADRDFILEVVKINHHIFKHIIDDFRADKEIAFAAVSKDWLELEYVDYTIKNDKQFMIQIINLYKFSGILKYISIELSKDKEFILNAINIIQKSKDVLKYVHNSLRDDIDFVKSCINKDPNSLQYASDRLKNNYDIVLHAIKLDGNVLEFANDKFKNNYDIVLTAVRNNGNVLIKLNEKFRNDNDLLLCAMRSGKYTIIGNYIEFNKNYNNIFNAANSNIAFKGDITKVFNIDIIDNKLIVFSNLIGNIIMNFENDDIYNLTLDDIAIKIMNKINYNQRIYIIFKDKVITPWQHNLTLSMLL